MNDITLWVMKADARKIFFCSLGVLLLATGWWVWKVFAPLENEIFSPQTATTGQSSSKPGLVAFLDEQSEREVTPPENLFGSGVRQRPRRRRHETVQVGTSSQQPKEEAVSITYRGMFQRTDGTVLALIEDSKTKRSAFYTENQRLLGHRINDISEQTVAVVRPDGSRIVLKVGAPQKLE